MHQGLRDVWTRALANALEKLRGVSIADSVVAWVWKRGGPGQWRGEQQEEPDISLALARAGLDTLGRELDEALHEYHPLYSGLVGTATLGLFNLGGASHIRSALGELWRRHAVVNDVAAFIDSEGITLDFVAPVINFHADEGVSTIELLPGATVRRLSDADATELFGGRGVVAMRPGRFAPLDYAFVGNFGEPKLFGDDSLLGSEEADRMRSTLELALRALRTFKKGAVGFDYVWIKARRFSPFTPGRTGRTFGAEYVPFGRYDIATGDVTELRSHSSYFRQTFHRSLSTACSRLGAAEIRTDPREKLFDAVVGLEAILLTELPDRYRGEPTYRFAMNLAVLQDAPKERAATFRLGKQLYHLRSTVAHGGELDPASVPYGDELVTLGVAAERSCELLRSTVKRFLAHAGAPPYIASGYWPDRYFSLALGPNREQDAPPCA